MTQKQAIQLFEDRKVRTVWDERTETWYFSVLDVISALTDTVNPTDYFKKMRKRDEALASFVGTNCPQIAMRSETGVMRKTLAGDVKTVLRIVDSRDRDAVRTPSDCYRLVVQQVPSHPGLFFFQ